MAECRGNTWLQVVSQGTTLLQGRRCDQEILVLHQVRDSPFHSGTEGQVTVPTGPTSYSLPLCPL